MASKAEATPCSWAANTEQLMQSVAICGQEMPWMHWWVLIRTPCWVPKTIIPSTESYLIMEEWLESEGLWRSPGQCTSLSKRPISPRALSWVWALGVIMCDPLWYIAIQWSLSIGHRFFVLVWTQHIGTIWDLRISTGNEFHWLHRPSQLAFVSTSVPWELWNLTSPPCHWKRQRVRNGKACRRRSIACAGTPMRRVNAVRLARKHARSKDSWKVQNRNWAELWCVPDLYNGPTHTYVYIIYIHIRILYHKVLNNRLLDDLLLDTLHCFCAHHDLIGNGEQICTGSAFQELDATSCLVGTWQTQIRMCGRARPLQFALADTHACCDTVGVDSETHHTFPPSGGTECGAKTKNKQLRYLALRSVW